MALWLGFWTSDRKVWVSISDVVKEIRTPGQGTLQTCFPFHPQMGTLTEEINLQ